MYRRYFKRILDILISLLAIIVLSPIIGFISILVWLNLGFPIIFKQTRPGLHEKLFTIYKFRSMQDIVNSSDLQIPDELRLTKFGKWLRKTSLDELPELFNILRGEMSLVGPRPLMPKYLDLYNEKQKHRHDVRPGLTGLAQINGRNAISWELKFEFDVKYTENLSFFEDLRILFITFIKVFKFEGIHSETSSTMEEFLGNNLQNKN